MNINRDIELIDELRRYPAETEWLEFKQDNIDPDLIGTRCSALANSARLAGKDTAYMLWGIANVSHAVTGTVFNPAVHKIKGQELQFWLAQRLQPSVAFSFRLVPHPEGNVVILEIPAATIAPVAFINIHYLRIGSATPKLTEFPERYQQLIERLRPFTWEHAIACQYITSDQVLELLDYSSYFRLTRQPLPETKSTILARLKADRLINPDVGNKWNITNLGAILFAFDLGKFDSHLARKAVRFVAYAGKTKATNATHRNDVVSGYAMGFDWVTQYIDNLLPKIEHIGTTFREVKPLFPVPAIRELVANALIHQDMTITGSGPQIDLFEDRIEITNPGQPLVDDPDRMIDLPPRSRNEAMAALMRRMNMCEEQGSGLDKVITEVEHYQLPPPLFRKGPGSMQVVLYGKRSFAGMTPDERVRACYQHSILKWLSGDRMKNASLCERFGIDPKNASQASVVIGKALELKLIKAADTEHPRAGYIPYWA